MAAKIIRDEIREREYDQSLYPTNEDIANIEKGKQWIPHHLLKTIVLSEVKQNSIGHAISAVISTSLCHNTNTVWGRC